MNAAVARAVRHPFVWAAAALVPAAVAAGGLASCFAPGGIGRALAAARPAYLLPCAGLTLGWWCCSGARLRLLAAALGLPLSFRAALRIALAGEFGAAATPAGVGLPALRIGLLHRRGLPLARAAVASAADGCADLLLSLLLAPAGLLVLPGLLASLDRAAAPPRRLFLLLGAAAAVAAAATALALRRGPRAPAGRPVAAGGLRRAWRRERRRGRVALALLRRSGPGLGARVLLLAAGQWGCRYALLPLVAAAFGAAGGGATLFLAQGFVLFAATLAVLPGGGGGVEVAVTFLLAGRLAPAEALAATLAWRLFAYYAPLLAGAVVLASGARSRSARGAVECAADGRPAACAGATR